MKYTINNKEVSSKEYFYSKEDGVHRTYYQCGQLNREATFVDRYLHGVSKEYYANGQLCQAVPYVNGMKRFDLKNNRLACLVLFGETVEEVV